MKIVKDTELKEVAGGLLNLYVGNVITQVAVGTSNTNIVGDFNDVHPNNIAIYKTKVNVFKFHA